MKNDDPDFDALRDSGISIMLDANCVNARQRDAALNQLEVLHADEVIDFIMCEISSDESHADGNAARREKALQYGYSLTHAETAEEQRDLRMLEQVVFPDGATSQNQRNDVLILFNALKYGRILVTRDGGSKRQARGILGSRDDLLKLGVRVMTPEEALDHVQRRVAMIKDQVRKVCANRGRPVPDWAARD